MCPIHHDTVLARTASEHDGGAVLDESSSLRSSMAATKRFARDYDQGE